MRKMLTIFVVCLAAAGTASAAGYRWTPVRAQNRVKAVYRTPDTTPQYGGGIAPDAIVDTAKCTGAGRPVNHRYAKLHCTVVMKGWGEYAQDGFHAVQKLTVTPRGAFTFTWTKGWR